MTEEKIEKGQELLGQMSGLNKVYNTACDEIEKLFDEEEAKVINEKIEKVLQGKMTELDKRFKAL